MQQSQALNRAAEHVYVLTHARVAVPSGLVAKRVSATVKHSCAAVVYSTVECYPKHADLSLVEPMDVDSSCQTRDAIRLCPTLVKSSMMYLASPNVLM